MAIKIKQQYTTEKPVNMFLEHAEQGLLDKEKTIIKILEDGQIDESPKVFLGYAGEHKTRIINIDTTALNWGSLDADLDLNNLDDDEGILEYYTPVLVFYNPEKNRAQYNSEGILIDEYGRELISGIPNPCKIQMTYGNDGNTIKENILAIPSDLLKEVAEYQILYGLIEKQTGASDKNQGNLNDCGSTGESHIENCVDEEIFVTGVFSGYVLDSGKSLFDNHSGAEYSFCGEQGPLALKKPEIEMIYDSGRLYFKDPTKNILGQCGDAQVTDITIELPENFNVENSPQKWEYFLLFKIGEQSYKTKPWPAIRDGKKKLHIWIPKEVTRNAGDCSLALYFNNEDESYPYSRGYSTVATGVIEQNFLRDLLTEESSEIQEEAEVDSQTLSLRNGDYSEPELISELGEYDEATSTWNLGNRAVSGVVDAGEIISKIKLNNRIYKIEDTVNKPIVEITYPELKELRNNSQLVAGQTYIITDYECTTTALNTRSAGHQFDIIVVADSVNTLNESARARLHEGDTYFVNCNLEAWELKYCFDNDIKRFTWADEEHGKGVIYYMKDEWDNEVSYDFKNIIYEKHQGFSYSQWGGNWFFVRNESLDVIHEEVNYYAYETLENPSAWSSNICYTRYPIGGMYTTATLYNDNFEEISYGGQITDVVKTAKSYYTFNYIEYDESYNIISHNSLHGKTKNIKIYPYLKPLYNDEYGDAQMYILNNIYFIDASSYVYLEECENMVFNTVLNSKFIDCHNFNLVINDVGVHIANSTMIKCFNLKIGEYAKNFYYQIVDCELTNLYNVEINSFEDVKMNNISDFTQSYVGPKDFSSKLSFRNCEFYICSSIEILKILTVNKPVDTIENCVFRGINTFTLDTELHKVVSGVSFYAFPHDDYGNVNNRRYFEYDDNGNLMCIARNSNGNFYGIINDGEEWKPISD